MRNVRVSCITWDMRYMGGVIGGCPRGCLRGVSLGGVYGGKYCQGVTHYKVGTYIYIYIYIVIDLKLI